MDRVSKCVAILFSLIQMVELVNGSGVYLYPPQLSIISASTKLGQATSLLMWTFFTREEAAFSNLTGRNGKKKLDEDIVQAIVGQLSSFLSHIWGQHDIHKVFYLLRLLFMRFVVYNMMNGKDKIHWS